jgi:arylsulfatase A-like enzyme
MTRRMLSSFALLLVGIGACAPDEPGRSVVVVTLDTTRADHLGVYGSPDVRTPTIDRLARSASQWEFGVADVPITLPSHTTLFTGYPAVTHGVRYNADLRVSPSADTIAERFRDLGYRTGAVVSTLVLDEKFGLAQGFDTYDDDLAPGYRKYDETKYTERDHWLPKGDRRAAETVDHAVAWLRDGRDPFFLWVHFYDAHFPYDPPPPWGATHRDAYAAEIQYVDHELKRLMRAIDHDTAVGDAIVFVTADHGEGLDQHREDGHGIFVYDDTIRIPWILRGPGLPVGIVSEQARTVDAPPTLLALAGHPDPDFGVGQDLAARGNRGAPADTIAYAESVKSKIFYGGSGVRALRTKHVKYVLAPREELYDLDVDPGETRNRIDDDPSRADAWRREMESRVRSLADANAPIVEPANADPRTLAALAALGYLSAGDAPAVTFDDLVQSGNDPKDLVDVSMSAQAIQNGYYDLAEQKLQRFFASPPSIDDVPGAPRLLAAAHQNWAKIWMIRGDYANAAEQYRLAQEADSTYDAARWCRIWTSNLAGRPDVAESEGAALLREFPNAWRVRYHRSLALALLGRRDEALRELNAIADEAPDEDGVARGARFYASRIGGPEEADALAAYLRQADS